MKTPLACNYAVIRFLPYRDTGEFVNVGVALFCPQTGFFDVKLETRNEGRITNFFPELDKNLFRRGRQSFQDELDRVRQLLNREDHTPNDLVKLGVFRELVKPRESLFQFSHVATVLSDDPATKLEELVDRLVNRQLAHAREDHEIVDEETGILEFAKAPMNREPIPAR